MSCCAVKKFQDKNDGNATFSIQNWNLLVTKTSWINKLKNGKCSHFSRSDR